MWAPGILKTAAEKTEGNKSTARPKHRWKNNAESYSKETWVRV
jgi:hypothetical protein